MSMDEVRRFDECMLKHARAMEVAKNMQKNFDQSRSPEKQHAPVKDCKIKMEHAGHNGTPPAGGGKIVPGQIRLDTQISAMRA